MKTYQSFKKVTAARITGYARMAKLSWDPLGNAWEITLDDGSQVQVIGERFARLEIGGYYVRADDGHDFYCDAERFGNAYMEVGEAPDPLKDIADATGAKIESVAALPDGSGAAVMSMPLPADHWLTQPGYNVPPMVFRKGTDDPERQAWAEKIRAAGRYAARCATMNGAEDDFDPDALVQNLIVGMLGYWTPDGLSSDPEANPL